MDKKGLAQGCAVIVVFGIVVFCLGALFGKYWL